MSKVAVIYFSSTGNTAAMADAVAEGAQTTAVDFNEFDAGTIGEYDGIALGCSAMGSEELDPDFQEFFESIVSDLAGKKVGLFGSYGWGDGQWMRDWQENAEGNGVTLVCDGVIANEYPDEDALEQCQQLGAQLAE